MKLLLIQLIVQTLINGVEIQFAGSVGQAFCDNATEIERDQT